jgi:chemotaxis protein MotB
MTVRAGLSFGAAASDADDGAHEGSGTQRWMVSYADFMTLLLVFFVALYALTAQRSARAEAAATAAKAAAARAASAAVASVPAQPVPVATPVAEPVPAPAPDAQRQAEERRDEMLAGLTTRLEPLVAAGQLRLAGQGRAIVLEIPEEALFASAEASPSPRAQSVLQALARELADSGHAIRVEGHTDNRRMSTAQFPSNWELSAARAAAVVRALQQQGLAAERLSAMGLADTRPKADNHTEIGRAHV